MKGINAGRVFKTIDTKEHIIHARKPKPRRERQSALCSLLVEASEKGFSLDSIALDTVVQSLQALNCVRATRRRPKPPKSASKLTARGLWLEPRLHN
jgi:hypothetical protein